MIIDVIASALLLIGCLLALVAGIGLLRFSDVLTRLHAATKPQSLGLVLILVAIALRAPDKSSITILTLVGVFALMTAPVSAHMIGRAAFRFNKVDRSTLTRDDLS
ncbi:monovalent cation/H(+) antiporter subunit G [Aeromicrobium sp. CTD01-1L150]|uniref:monovalent cation/H(+) antiporter subunit G n=1 Tax=Aeromicrobium sp. CTD01-1L150 TaxID=3341830 RepID=UPI0035C05A1C